MTYDTRDKILQIGVYEKVKLSYKEDKLLICLSSNRAVRYEDILKKIGISMDELKYLKQRLLQDTKYRLNISTINKEYRLEDEIYFK